MPFPPTWFYFQLRGKAVLDSRPDSCKSLLQGQEQGEKCCEPCRWAAVESTAVTRAALGLGAGRGRWASVLTAPLAARRRGPHQGSSKHHLPPCHAPPFPRTGGPEDSGDPQENSKGQKRLLPHPTRDRMLFYLGEGPNGSVRQRREFPRV